MSMGNLFSVGDKGLSDALSQGAVTKALIRHFFFKRGVVISEDTDRKVLALYFSRLPPDYQDFHELAELLQPTDTRDKFTSKRVVTQLKFEDIETVAHELKSAIEQDGFSADVKVFNNKIVSIQIRYKEQNFNRNEFRQTVSKTAEISFEIDSAGTTVRYDHNRSVDDWATRALSLLQHKVGEEMQVDEIDLSHIDSPKLRTKFFIDLMNNVEGFPFSDVTDAFAHNPKKERTTDGSVDEGIHISKASLKGEGILRSAELLKLLEQGFFISKIIWTARASDGSSDLYEFEAMFADPETCTGFSYLPRGFYRFENGEYSLSRSPFPRSSDRTLSKQIELAAHRVLQSLQV